MPTRKKTPWPAEWWHGEGMYYTAGEIRDVERWLKIIPADDTPAIPDLRPVRRCRDCGDTFHSDRKATNQRCPSCKSKHASRSRIRKGDAA